LSSSAVKAPALWPGLDVEVKITHQQEFVRVDVKTPGRLQNPFGIGFGADGIVAGDDQVEIGKAQVFEIRQRPFDRRQAVAGQDADRQSLGAEKSNEFLGAVVRARLGRRRHFHGVQRGLVLPALRFVGQGRNVFQDGLVRGAADGGLDGLEIDGKRARQRAVEVKKNPFDAVFSERFGHVAPVAVGR
jgi:hypothetical protein